MRNKPKHRTILINGIRYYADRPQTCRTCFFWKNRKRGCIFGEQNCYYLAEAVMTEQERKCEGCTYARNRRCVSAACYRDLEREMRAMRNSRTEQGQKEGDAHE